MSQEELSGLANILAGLGGSVNPPQQQSVQPTTGIPQQSATPAQQWTQPLPTVTPQSVAQPLPTVLPTVQPTTPLPQVQPTTPLPQVTPQQAQAPLPPVQPAVKPTVTGQAITTRPATSTAVVSKAAMQQITDLSQLDSVWEDLYVDSAEQLSRVPVSRPMLKVVQPLSDGNGKTPALQNGNLVTTTGELVATFGQPVTLPVRFFHIEYLETYDMTANEDIWVKNKSILSTSPIALACAEQEKWSTVDEEGKGVHFFKDGVLTVTFNNNEWCIDFKKQEFKVISKAIAELSVKLKSQRAILPQATITLKTVEKQSTVAKNKTYYALEVIGTEIRPRESLTLDDVNAYIAVRNSYMAAVAAEEASGIG